MKHFACYVNAFANAISLSDSVCITILLRHHTVTPGIGISHWKICNVYVSKVFGVHSCHKMEGDEKVGRK
jgi:hypothetical protein